MLKITKIKGQEAKYAFVFDTGMIHISGILDTGETTDNAELAPGEFQLICELPGEKDNE